MPKLNETEEIPVTHEFEPQFEPMYDFGFAEKEMSQKVPNKLTKLTPDAAAQAISEAYRQVIGSKPSRAILALLIGQVALETGNFNSIHNFNFGNVRGEAPDGKYTSFRASEIIKGKEEFWEEDDPRNKFRAYDDATAGAKDYIRQLRAKPHWWSGLQTQTVDGFIKGLTTYPAYFTANKDLYARVLQERMDKFFDLAKKYGASGAAVVVGALLAGAAGYMGVKKYREG